MTLDKLYSLVKRAKYPINDRDALIQIIGAETIVFDGHKMDAEEIAVHIKYPIKSVSEFFKDFMQAEAEEYGIDEALSLGQFESRVEE